VCIYIHMYNYMCEFTTPIFPQVLQLAVPKSRLSCKPPVRSRCSVPVQREEGYDLGAPYQPNTGYVNCQVTSSECVDTCSMQWQVTTFVHCFFQVPGDQRVFRVSKGVSTVDYCPKNNVVVTGSVDQLIRIWNPFVTR